LKPAKQTISSRPDPLVGERRLAQRQAAHPEKLGVDVKTDKGQLTIVGTATAVIAALAVIGLIVVSIYVLKLAERAIERGEHEPAVQPVAE